MKKLLPVFLLLASLKLSAQNSTYVSMISDSSEWSNYLTGCQAFGPQDIECDDNIYKLRFGGDSLYNGYQYRIIDLWPASYDNINNSLYYDSTYKIPCALLREDSGKIFVKHLYYTALNGGTPVTDKEILLYDFNLAVGDTFFFQDTLVYEWNQPHFFIVGSVDSMQTNLGYRKTIALAPSGNNFYINDMYGAEVGLKWIEGIGSSKGLLYDIDYQLISTFGLQWYYFHFMCYTFNGQYVYGSGSCDYPLSINEQKQNPITIYPNPTDNSVTVKLPINYSSGTLQIIDLQGKVVKMETLSGNSQTIATDNLPGGVYQLIVSSKDKLLGRQKLVVVR